jgi:hypothetical protein
MIAYSTQLFAAPQIFRVGFALDLLGIALLLTAVGAVWRLSGLV